MNTPALVSRLDHKALPQWNSGAPGYIALQNQGADDASRQSNRVAAGIRRYWWLAVLIWAAIGIPATLAIYKNIQPQYVAQGRINVTPYRVDPFSGKENITPFYIEYLRTQADLMKDRTVLKAAAASLGKLAADTKGTKGEMLQWFKALPDPVGYLEQNLTVEAIAATQNIRISMTHNDPLSASTIVKHVMDAYAEDTKSRITSTIERDRKEVIPRRDSLLTALYGNVIMKNNESTSERDGKGWVQQLDGLRKDSGWTEDARRVVSGVLTSSKTLIQELEKSRLALSSQLEALKTRPLPDKETFLASVVTDGDPQIQLWNKELSDNALQDSVLATKFKATERHPDRAALRGQRIALERKIADRKKEMRDNAWRKHEADIALERELKLAALTSDLAAVEKQLAMLQERHDTQETTVRDLGNKAVVITTLEAQIAEAKDELKRYETRLAEINNLNTPIGRVEYYTPDTPITPTVDKRPKLALAANGLGLMLGLGVLVIMMKLRDKIDYTEDLPNSFQPLVVGTVSHAGIAARGMEGRMSKKILGEEMRLLHANLLPPGPMQRRIMMITSPTPSNGKTSIASQLALSLAKSGLEVLLIDADLRKRDLSTMFDVGFRPGLADLLQGRPPELIRPVELLPNLRLMGAGTKLDRNPVELFQRKHFHESLNLLQEKFDCIVVDTPPTLVVADARLIARSADEVLCVVRAQVSSPKDVNQTLDALQRITGKTPKIILNGVAHKQSYYKYKFAYTSGENEVPEKDADSLD